MKTIYKSLDFIVKDNGQYVDGFYEYSGDIPNLPQRLNRSLQVISPTALFILNDKPIILFLIKMLTEKRFLNSVGIFQKLLLLLLKMKMILTFIMVLIIF